MIKRTIKLILKSAYVPVIKKKEIVKGKQHGGIKLIYTEVVTLTKHINLLLFTIPWVISVTNSEIVFLRPFKKHWDTSKHKLNPYLWGSKDNALTNIWCQVNSNYKDITTEYKDIQFVKIYKNHISRGLLNKKKAVIHPEQLMSII